MIEKESKIESPNTIFVVTGLALGEETKGATVEWITKQTKAKTVIRSGGCQAGHHVVKKDGREQMLSHFSCGVFEGAETILKHMVMNPVDLFDEAMQIEEKGVIDPFSLITISSDCLTITPFHGAYCRLLEISRGKNKKGTVGMGVGEAIEDSKKYPNLAIRAGEFKGKKENLEKKTEDIRQFKLQQARELLKTAQALSDLEEVKKEMGILENEALVSLTVQSFQYLADLVRIVDESYLEDVLNAEGAIVCEPSHGALHHPKYGFVPHVTQIDPTSQDVLKTLKEHEHNKKVVRLGVSRCYLTRHGAGPLPSFDRELTDQIKETHNAAGSWWLGEFRNGFYDPIVLKYAIEISGGKNSFDGLIISFMDKLKNVDCWQVVDRYIYEGEDVDDLENFFDLDNGIIKGIKVFPGDNEQLLYEHQVRLTKLINKCRPITKTLVPSENKTLEEVFIDFVEENLGIPVVALSRGPKAEDKEIRLGFEDLFNPS